MRDSASESIQISLTLTPPLTDLDKRAVERGVMCDHRATTDKIGESGDGAQRPTGHLPRRHL